MSSFFPPEILDLIVDHLHDEQTTLRACCLVSKSWVPRTRIHLFNCVSFSSSGPTLKSWMQTFPDPSNSPTRYTRILHLSDFKAVTVAISDARPWVQSFNHIVDLRVVTIGLNDPHISFNQLRRLSPTLKSLQLFCSFAPLPEILDCVCSFPLLEDLSLCSVIPRVQENVTKWNAPPTSPKFTGSLFISCKNRDIARELLALPGGLHFSKLTVVCPIGDGNLSKELVSACSDTLKSLTVDFYRDMPRAGVPPSINLSEATELKDVEFRLREPNIGWINATLQTARSKNLQQITIHFFSPLPHIFPGPINEMTRREWQDLDHLLVQLWTTFSIRLVFVYTQKKEGGTGSGVPVPKLLPELASRGFDVV